MRRKLGIIFVMSLLIACCACVGYVGHGSYYDYPYNDHPYYRDYDYYYYPDRQVYYYPASGVYWWFDGGIWVSGHRPPPRFVLRDHDRVTVRLQ